MALNRKEAFLAAIAGEDVGELKPKNRQEAALDKIAKGGGGGGGGVFYVNFTQQGSECYCDCTNADILNAVESGKIVIAKADGRYLPLNMVNDTAAKFAGIIGDDSGNVSCEWATLDIYNGAKCGYTTIIQADTPM